MKTFIAAVMCLSTSLLFAQSIHKIEVKSEITSAIVYLDGAEVSRSKTVNIRKGKNELVFTNLSPKLNGKTIQINTLTGIDILSITTKINHLALGAQSVRITSLKDSMTLMQQKVINLQDEKSAYAMEKELLVTNKSLGGSESGVSITDLKTAADYYRSRILEINKATSKLNRKLAAHQVTINNINRQLRELNIDNNVQRGEVSVLILSKDDAKIPFDLRYLVSEVGWIPTYDIKANEINEPIQLIYRAKVYNNSDIPWKNIKLTLSSADPNLSASKPNLEPWYLSYRNDKANSKPQFQNAYSQSSAGSVMAPSALLKIMRIQKALVSLIHFRRETFTFTKIAVSDMNVEFEIDDRYSIPSDAKPYFIEIKEYELQATFKHFTIPKLGCDAYLLARITGWEDLDILEGTANVYLHGTYTGQSFIDTRNINDTLDISLGRDNRVQVHRKRLVDFSSEKLIGANRKEEFTYQIQLKNNHKIPISIDVLDQIPVPQDSDIEITDLKLSDASRNEINGELMWNYSLAPAEAKAIDFSFSIKYPKNKPLNTKRQKYKTVRWM